jgi:formylmethanofuran dehydrogenase subunit C
LSDGILARLRAPLDRPADFGEVLAGAWGSLSAGDLARRPVYLAGSGSISLGELFQVTGGPAGRVRFEGDLSNAHRLGARLTEGEVFLEGNVGREAGLGMAGGSIDVHGSAGSGAGGAAPEARRGMTGGELIVRGAAGSEAGSRMRRGLLVIGGSASGQVGLGMIAGTVAVFGDTGSSPGLWSKRGSIVALGAVAIPPTYRYACTYRPVHLQLTLIRLRKRYALPVEERHLSGLYRRFSGDLADLGKGEILAWTT